MKCAVLCNGPSRISYQSREGYDFVIGCNVPWTEVDATVVLDHDVIMLWSNNPDLITVPTYFGPKAWMKTDAIKKRQLFHPYFVDLLHVGKNYHSSGHCAAEVCIRRGASAIDIYGCDSWFESTIYSYTREHLPDKIDGAVLQHQTVDGWRQRWNKIIDSYPHITFNFIR